MRHTTYAVCGRQVILKIAPPVGAEVLAYEQDIMARGGFHARAAQIRASCAEIYYFDQAHDLCDSDYFFMEKLSGENFGVIRQNCPPKYRHRLTARSAGSCAMINTFTGSFFGYDGNPNLRAATWKEAFIKIVDSVLDDGVKKGAEYGISVDEIRAVVQKHAGVLEEITTR
jgi:hypothetical protein